jgi:hypothetical protein
MFNLDSHGGVLVRVVTSNAEGRGFDLFEYVHFVPL